MLFISVAYYSCGNSNSCYKGYNMKNLLAMKEKLTSSISGYWITHGNAENSAMYLNFLETKIGKYSIYDSTFRNIIDSGSLKYELNIQDTNLHLTINYYSHFSNLKNNEPITEIQSILYVDSVLFSTLLVNKEKKRQFNRSTVQPFKEFAKEFLKNVPISQAYYLDHCEDRLQCIYFMYDQVDYQYAVDQYSTIKGILEGPQFEINSNQIILLYHNIPSGVLYFRKDKNDKWKLYKIDTSGE